MDGRQPEIDAGGASGKKEKAPAVSGGLVFKGKMITKNSSSDDPTLDLVTFRDGRIVDFLQCTDTALVMSLTAPPRSGVL